MPRFSTIQQVAGAMGLRLKVEPNPVAPSRKLAAGQMAGTIKQDAEGMADAIATISANMVAGTDMFAGLNANYVVTDGWKVAIPYAVYTGE